VRDSQDNVTVADKLIAAITLAGALLLAWYVIDSRAERAAAAIVPVLDVLSKEESINAMRAGSPSTNKVIVEFSDFQCPFCGEFAREIHPKVMSELVDRQEVGYMLFDYPLETIHPRARRLAIAARCAQETHHYWQMYELLFTQVPALATDDGMFALVSEAHIDPGPIRRCLDEPPAEIEKAVAGGIEVARRLGIQSIPTLYGGVMTPEGEVKLTAKLVGARTVTNIKRLLE
jgi:protein-disulfide isomerase